MTLDLEHLIGLGTLQILQGDLQPISSGDLKRRFQNCKLK